MSVPTTRSDITGRRDLVRLMDSFYDFDPANLTPEQRARYAAYRGETPAS